MAKKRGNKRRQTASSIRSVPLDRILFYGVVFLVFALPLFIWPGISEYGYGKTIVALIGISALAILWGVSAWQKGTWTIRIPWIMLPVLGLVAASLLSMLHATNGRVVIQSLALLVFFALFLVLVANAVRDQRDINLLLYALLAAGFLVALYGLLQYLGTLRGPMGYGGLGNVISTLGNRNYIGGFLAYLLFPAVVLVVRPRSRWVRISSILLVAFCFGMVLVVRQSGTLIALILSSIAFVVGWLIFRPVEPIRRNRVWLLILLGVLAFTFLVEAPSGPLNSIVGLSSEGPSRLAQLWQRSSDYTRSWDWWIGWEMFKDHPLTGIGLGNYKLDFLPYKASFLATPRGQAFPFYINRAAQAHSEFVQVLAELGVLGALALVSLLAGLIVSLWKRLRHNEEENRFDLLLFSCGIATFLIHGAVSFPAHLPASSLVLILAAGLVFSRVYGESGVFCIRWTGWTMKSAVLCVVLIGLAVSVIAGRDLSANLLMSKGVEQAQLGNTYGAESYFEDSIRLDFAPRQTYFHIATVQIARGAYEEAQVNLERCLTRFLDETVYLNYANLMANAHQFDKAQEAIRLLLATRPLQEMEVRARYLDAIILAQSGDPQTATALLEALVQYAPRFQTAYIGLGLIYQANGLPIYANQAFEEALRLIDEKLAIAQATLESQTTITAEKYGALRTEIEQLRQERATVLSNLE